MNGIEFEKSEFWEFYDLDLRKWKCGNQKI